MRAITIQVTNADARGIYAFLRDRYSKDNRATIEKLCEIAIQREVADQARIEYEEADRKWREECDDP